MYWIYGKGHMEIKETKEEANECVKRLLDRFMWNVEDIIVVCGEKVAIKTTERIEKIEHKVYDYELAD